MNDTDPEVAEKFRELIMACSGEERFMMGIRSFDAARDIALASLPKELTSEERNRRLFERIYGAPLEDFVTGAVNSREEP
jgi:hypothetical protein